MNQIVDIGNTRRDLERYLADVGYWATAEDRARYGYVLSPCAYVLTPLQKVTMTRLSRTVYSAVVSLSRRLSELSRAKSLTNDEARFLSLATSATRGLLGPKDIDGAVPPVLKVDIMQAESGAYKIAEVDSYNPRGLAFVSLIDATAPGRLRSGPGIQVIADLMKSISEEPWGIIVSERERFYVRAFEVMKKKLLLAGIRTRLFFESEINTELSELRRVLMIPETLDRNVVGRESLVNAHKNYELYSLFPPAAYLGSKAFLPYLSEQQGMREFVPACSLVNKRIDPLAVCNGGPYVLKGLMSSGMKQILFSDEDESDFNAALTKARGEKRSGWMMQQAVSQKPHDVEVFEHGATLVRPYYLRITAYVSAQGLVGAVVTGRPDKKVHGAPDCIQIPVICQ